MCIYCDMSPERWNNEARIHYVHYITRSSSPLDCIVNEAIETELHPKNMNRVVGFCLSKSLKPLICSLKKHP
jgi:hypothetical protein